MDIRDLILWIVLSAFFGFVMWILSRAFIRKDDENEEDIERAYWDEYWEESDNSE